MNAVRLFWNQDHLQHSGDPKGMSCPISPRQLCKTVFLPPTSSVPWLQVPSGAHVFIPCIHHCPQCHTPRSSCHLPSPCVFMGSLSNSHPKSNSPSVPSPSRVSPALVTRVGSWTLHPPGPGSCCSFQSAPHTAAAVSQDDLISYRCLNLSVAAVTRINYELRGP